MALTPPTFDIQPQLRRITEIRVQVDQGKGMEEREQYCLIFAGKRYNNEDNSAQIDGDSAFPISMVGVVQPF